MIDILLEEFYKTDLHTPAYVERKYLITAPYTFLFGISQSGKTFLIKRYLLGLKKSSYLYINLNDFRIDITLLNQALPLFCQEHKIECLVLEHYDVRIELPPVARIILSSQKPMPLPQTFQSLHIFPLDYEEFLAFEHKYDSTVLNHFLQLGGFPKMSQLSADEQIPYLQQTLYHALESIEFDLFILISRYQAQKISAFSLYERLKIQRKISKDKLYKALQNLVESAYVHTLSKFQHARATKKLYLCDIALKTAFSTQKHFGRLFENLLYLEMKKRRFEIFYDEGIDFYLPAQNRVVLARPFSDGSRLFQKIEAIEAFLITHQVKKVEIVTMASQTSLKHPFFEVEMLPFSQWAIIEGEDL